MVGDLLNISGLSSASSHVAEGVATALTVGAGLSGDGDVDDPGNPIGDAVVVGADGGRDGTVVIRLAAGLTFESLEVAVLADLLLPGLLHVADQVCPLAGSLLIALPLALAGLRAVTNLANTLSFTIL